MDGVFSGGTGECEVNDLYWREKRNEVGDEWIVLNGHFRYGFGGMRIDFGDNLEGG